MSTQQLDLRPSPVPLENTTDECVRDYSHDSALGEGEVLHQDVQTSVLIVEELPHPPVDHPEVNRTPNESNTPTSLGATFPREE